MKDTTTFSHSQELSNENNDNLMKDSGKVTDVSFESVEVKPSERKELGKEPLLYKFIDNLSFAKDHFNIKNDSLEIDNFINNEINRLHLKDNEESYKKILDKYIKDINQYDIYSKIDILIKKINIDKKILEAENERKELLNADPITLSSKKLLERFKLTRI